MSKPRRPEPTQEELRSAWLRCRKPTWPRTFEEAMEHTLFSRLVRINALHPPRSPRRGAEPPRLAVKWGSAIGKTEHLPALPAGLDRKRAAAGDREDD